MANNWDGKPLKLFFRRKTWHLHFLNYFCNSQFSRYAPLYHSNSIIFIHQHRKSNGDGVEVVNNSPPFQSCATLTNLLIESRNQSLCEARWSTPGGGFSPGHASRKDVNRRLEQLSSSPRIEGHSVSPSITLSKVAIAHASQTTINEEYSKFKLSKQCQMRTLGNHKKFNGYSWFSSNFVQKLVSKV